jgi:S-methylmethionine-dependent homocysteine/selenocysteine methylase
MTSVLPHLAGPLFLADGGLETTLIFHEGVDLPEFAAFPLLDTPEGRELLRRYYSDYLELARRHGLGFVLDTVTWRANPDWAGLLGYDAAALDRANRQATQLALDLAAEFADLTTVVNGVIGPRGDGYVVASAMSADEAADYHAAQTTSFAAAGADLVTAMTMTYVEEAVGVARAAAAAGLPVTVGFTVETDGRLPSGTPLGEAVTAVDEATGGSVASFMVNCAHPSHFADVLATAEAWTDRVAAVRANASRASHAELDEAEDLDRGDPRELGQDYVALRAALPGLRVVGGCCGTDLEHVAAIADALT